MRLRFSYLTIASICLSLTVTGCSLQGLLGNKKNSSSQPQKPQSTVAAFLRPDDPNAVLLKKGIDDMAAKENVTVKYLSNAPAASPEQSQSDASSGTSSGSSGQGQNPLQDAKVLLYQGGDPELLQMAQTKKVPILAIDQIPSGSKPLGLIVPDQEKIGELMGQALTGKVQAGKALLLQDNPTEIGAQERLAGIRTVLSTYPKLSLQVIAGQAGSETLAKQAFLQYLQKNPGKVQAVLADSERMAAQAAEVLKNEKLEKKIPLFGGQANIQSLQRMAGGTQMGDVDVSPYLQGVDAFQWAEKVIKKETFDVNDSVTGDQGEIPAKVVTVKAVTPENLAVTQQSYVKAVKLAQSAPKQQASKKPAAANQGSSGQQSTDQKQQSNQSGSDGGSGSGGQSGASGGGQSGGQSGGTVPPGAVKVTEKVNTDITREYLDAKGKVLWTEHSSSQQVRTVPPEMLNQGQGQQQNASGGQQKSSQQGSDQSGGGGSGGGGGGQSGG